MEWCGLHVEHTEGALWRRHLLGLVERRCVVVMVLSVCLILMMWRCTNVTFMVVYEMVWSSCEVWNGMVFFDWCDWLVVWRRLQWSGLMQPLAKKTLWWHNMITQCIYLTGWPGEDDGWWWSDGMVMDDLWLPDLWRHAATMRMTVASLCCLDVK